MLNTTIKRLGQKLLGSKNASKTTGSLNENMKRIPVYGSPFEIVGDDKRGYALTIGKFRLSDILKTPDDVTTWLHKNEWNVITQLIGTLVPEIIKQEQQKHN